MRGVRAFADRADAVERRDAESGGEVAVGAAACRGFFELHAQFGRLIRRASAEQSGDAFLRSIGGRLRPPVTSSEQRLSNGFSARNF